MGEIIWYLPFSFWVLCLVWHFPGGSDGNESACNSGNPGLVTGLQRSSEEWNGHPLQYSCWEIPWTEEPGRLQSMGLQQRIGHPE